MTKKDYMKPSLKVVKLQHKSTILNNSIKKVETSGLDEALEKGGAGDSYGEAMSRRRSEWDEEEEEW